VPTEIRVSTIKDYKGPLGILSIQTTEGFSGVRRCRHPQRSSVRFPPHDLHPVADSWPLV